MLSTILTQTQMTNNTPEPNKAIEEFVSQLSTTKKAHLIDGKIYYTESDVFEFFTSLQSKHEAEKRELVKYFTEIVEDMMEDDEYWKPIVARMKAAAIAFDISSKN